MNFHIILLLLLVIINLMIFSSSALATLSLGPEANEKATRTSFIPNNNNNNNFAREQQLKQRRLLINNDPIYGKLNSYFHEEETRALATTRYSTTTTSVNGEFFSNIREEQEQSSGVLLSSATRNVHKENNVNNQTRTYNRRFAMEQLMVEEVSATVSLYDSAAVTAKASIPTVYLFESLDETSENNTCTSVNSPCKNWTMAVNKVFSLCEASVSKLPSKTVNSCEAKIELLSGVNSCEGVIPQLLLYQIKISIYSSTAQYKMICGGNTLSLFGNLLTGVSDASNVSLSFNNIGLTNVVFIFSSFGEVSFNGTKLDGVFFNTTIISRFTLSKSYASDLYLAQFFTKFSPISTDFLTLQQSILEYCYFSVTSRAIDIKSNTMTNIRMTFDALSRVVIRDSSFSDSTVLISSSDLLIGTGFAEFSFYIVNISFSRSSLIVTYYRNGRALVSSKLYVIGCNFSGKAPYYQVSVVDFTTITIDNCIFNGLNTYSEYSALSIKSYYSKTEAEITSTTFSNYYSKASGAALNIYGVEIGYIADCIFKNNTALDNGGALTIDRVGLATVQYCKFVENKFESKRESQFFSYGGGALYVYKSFIELTKNLFTKNSANGLGGAIIVNTACSVKTSNDVFDDNYSLYGGAIAYTDYQLNDCSNVVFFTYNSTFINNKAKYFGGFFFGRKLPVMYFDTFTSFRLNSAQLSGGGIYYLEKPAAKKVINGDPEKLGFGNTGMYTSSNIESFPTRMEVYSKSSMESQSGVLTNMHFFLLDENNQTTPYFPGMMDLELQADGLSFIVTKFTFSNTSRTLKLDYTFYSKTAEFPFQSNLLLILRLKEFDIAQYFDFTATTCNIGYYVIRDEDNETLYKCSLTLTITLSATIAGILLLFIGFLVGFFFLRMIRRITTIVMDYKKKELAEKELTERLMSYQVLFEHGDVELDGYKQWMIPVKDLEIISKIGEGAYGTVYKALWKTNVEVAIKSIKVDEDSISTFEHEASLLSSCRHLNIVTFYGCTITGETNYLVEEYMSGGGLDKMLYRVGKGLIAMSLKQKLRILIDVSCGMSYLNELKPPIIHRDLKPENILLTRDMVAKVSDFGLSTISNPQRTMTCQIGSLFYMAPELFNSNYYNEKCDVYSFSIVMWELFFGTRYSSFGGDANDRFKFLLTREQILELSTLATSSIAFVLKKVAEGTRLPLPNSTSSHLKWIRAFMPEHSSNDEHCKVIVKVVEKYFTLMVECWDNDHSKRPGFRDIMYRLKEMVALLYFDECTVRTL